MNRTKTARGFDLIEFKDSYGETCSIQTSSSTDEPKIWLGIDDPKMIVFEDESMGNYVKIDMPKQFSAITRMHLTVGQVKELLPILENFVKTGSL